LGDELAGLIFFYLVEIKYLWGTVAVGCNGVAEIISLDSSELRARVAM
jgi:hypothetical protein